MRCIWQVLLLLKLTYAQNPIEQMASSALNIGNQLLNQMQEGAAIKPQLSFETPLMAVRSKSAVGHGDAMRLPRDDSEDSDSESAERRRRRRKRAPCMKKMMGATTEAAEDDVEARRRRAARKRAANNSSRSRVTKKKLLLLHRRRRQLMPEQTAQQPAQQLAGIGERFKGMWLAFVDNVMDVVQQMHQKMKGTAESGF
ncbi:uncharacterized protein LOC108605571 [Drosophila busckii]|uniref:uncharacterized protein LOC108605571 n=1 Tax=Drosophila busckii TaxID=30019 RepID=UPI00083EDDF1|nr:uncharacterized protein LOC108605571 [Drosophila busckii]